MGFYVTELNYLRNRFEQAVSNDGQWPQAIEKSPDGSYKLAQTATAWGVWQSAIEAVVSEIME